MHCPFQHQLLVKAWLSLPVNTVPSKTALFKAYMGLLLLEKEQKLFDGEITNGDEFMASMSLTEDQIAECKKHIVASTQARVNSEAAGVQVEHPDHLTLTLILTLTLTLTAKP